MYGLLDETIALDFDCAAALYLRLNDPDPTSALLAALVRGAAPPGDGYEPMPPPNSQSDNNRTVYW